MVRRLVGPTLLSLSLLTACGEETSSTLDPNLFPPLNRPESCTIALTPHQGEDAWDLQIIRFQREAAGAVRPVDYVERLGWAFVAKARASYDPGYYRLAEQCASCIDEMSPESSEAMLLRAHVLHNLHQFKQAESVARRLVAARGLSFDYGVLGDALVEQGKLSEATKAYQAMMDQKPSPQAYSRAAHVRWLKGELPGAIELMRMTVGATGSGDRESAAWARVRLALYELQAGRIAKAGELIDAALELKPDDAFALLTNGRVLLAEGKEQDAIRSFARAERLNPLPEYQWALIDALRWAGRGDEAATVEAVLMDRGASEDPRTFALYLSTEGNDLPTAVRLAREEMTVRADIFTVDALAWALRGTGEIAEARALSVLALAEGTRDARLFLHAGVIAAESGLTQEAVRWLDEASDMAHMLLPSEQEHLRVAVADLNVVGAEESVTDNQKPKRRTI